MNKIKPYNKYKVNPANFIDLFTPTSSYILGLLWADGYVQNSNRKSNISLSTTYPDADYFIPLFLGTGKWKHYSIISKKHPTWKTKCEIKTNNRPLAEFLVKHDYVSKSNVSADKILSIIPENLHCYWFRGLFDGDGHIHTDNKGTHKIIFSSSYNQDWTYMQQLCHKLNIKYTIQQYSTSTGSSSRFNIYGMYQVIKLCNFMYFGYPYDNLGLRRKHDIFLQLKSIEEKNRYKGISQLKNGKWRSYTSSAGKQKGKSLGIHITKEKALEAVEKFYSTHPKCFLN